jgi:glycosyltransferase involved in cell wall biosynthesis
VTLSFVLPAIHRRPTGGNIYNRHIRAELRKLPAIDGDISLVDSLMLDQIPDGRRVLIAHYLHVVDPSRRDSREAKRERKLLPRFEGIVTTSDYSREALQDFANVVSIWPGLSDRFRVPVKARDNRTILTVASLLPGKGLLQFVDVLESIDDLDWRWILAGDPTLDPAYANRVRKRIAGSNRIKLLGPMSPSRLVALYDRAGIFALPTRFETCSMATREAMARALPVVAYDTGGVRANLPAPNARRLAPPDDGAALAAELRRLLTDAEARRVEGEANRAAALRFPTWAESAKKLWSFLRSLG